jgi:hypothetical protein
MEVTYLNLAIVAGIVGTTGTLFIKYKLSQVLASL